MEIKLLKQNISLLEKDLSDYCRRVESLIKVKITDNQFAALVSLAYNIGVSAFGGSTLLSYLNKGNYSAAADQFARWNKGGGKVLAGLTRRREAERKLFLTP